MELVSTIEINGEEREIADAYAREQCTANAEVIDGINNDLDGLSYDENAGGKNLLDSPNPYSVTGKYSKFITVKVKKNTNYTLSAGSVTSSVFQGIIVRPINSDTNIIAKYGEPYIMKFNSGDNESIRIFFYSGNGTSGTSVYSDVQLEEGTEQTPYEPYIPSVKMLADEVSAQNESLSALGKCKNLLNPTLQTTTVNGITCTDNGDGTYALNGTATADLDLCIKGFKNLQLNKEYKMLGCPSGGSDSTYMLYDSSESDIKDIGKGKVYTPTKQPNINIRIMNGVTVNNLVFKPMLTTNLSATYDDFVPYTGDGETLTADVAELKNDLSDSLPVGTILTVVDSATMSSDVWKLLKTGTLSYQDGGALVEISTITYQKIK